MSALRALVWPLLFMMVVLTIAPAAFAQSTGGSFGGGSFSSTPSSNAGSGSTSSGSSSSSSDDADEDDGSAIFAVLILAGMLVWNKPLMGIPIFLASLLLGLAWLIADKEAKALVSIVACVWALGISWASSNDTVGWVMASISVLPFLVLGFQWGSDKWAGRTPKRARISKRDVSVVTLAVDPAVRPMLESMLGDASRPSKRSARALRMAAEDIRLQRPAWRSGAVKNFLMRNSRDANTSFDREVEVAQERARLGPTGSAPEVASVLTLVIFSKSELPEIWLAASADGMSQLLLVLEGHELLGERRFEAIWAPVEGGGLSDEDLARHHPELQRFDG